MLGTTKKKRETFQKSFFHNKPQLSKRARYKQLILDT